MDQVTKDLEHFEKMAADLDRARALLAMLRNDGAAEAVDAANEALANHAATIRGLADEIRSKLSH